MESLFGLQNLVARMNITLVPFVNRKCPRMEGPMYILTMYNQLHWGASGRSARQRAKRFRFGFELLEPSHNSYQKTRFHAIA